MDPITPRDYRFEKAPKDKFLDLCKDQVLKNLEHGHPYNLDLTQMQFDTIVQENKFNSTEAINWLFDSGLYVTDETHQGWFTPSLREEFLSNS